MNADFSFNQARKNTISIHQEKIYTIGILDPLTVYVDDIIATPVIQLHPDTKILFHCYAGIY